MGVSGVGESLFGVNLNGHQEENHHFLGPPKKDTPRQVTSANYRPVFSFWELGP